MSQHSSSSSSDHSSLLQQHRPNDLAPQTKSRQASVSESQATKLEMHETSRLMERGGWVTGRQHSPAGCRSPSASSRSMFSSQHSSYFPSMPAGPSGWARPCSPCRSTDLGEPDRPSLERSNSTSTGLLSFYSLGAHGVAVPKEQWQPDQDSALCSIPECSIFFSAPHALFGPRRHHCRACGNLVCADHSSQRRPLFHQTSPSSPHMGPIGRVATERVCDACFPRSDAPLDRQRSSISDHSTSAASTQLLTPESEDPLSVSALICRRPSFTQELDENVTPTLAPIRSWMDSNGVLSLYPLAACASHSSIKSPVPAAAPLFAPSLHARRTAKVKEHQRLSLRQRRFGENNTGELWIPEMWGYKRSEFMPDEVGEMPQGGLVVDGPIRLRASGLRRTPVTTPSDERKTIVLA